MENAGEKEGNHRFGKYQARQIKKQCGKKYTPNYILKTKPKAGQKEPSCAHISAMVSSKKWHCFEMGLNKQTSPSWRKKLVHEWLCTKQLPTGLEQMPVALSCPDSHRNRTWSKTGRDKVINSSLVLQRSKRVKTISHSNYLPGTRFSGQQNALSKRTGVIKLLGHVY